MQNFIWIILGISGEQVPEKHMFPWDSLVVLNYILRLCAAAPARDCKLVEFFCKNFLQIRSSVHSNMFSTPDMRLKDKVTVMTSPPMHSSSTQRNRYYADMYGQPDSLNKHL
jgi:hypothetical protein